MAPPSNFYQLEYRIGAAFARLTSMWEDLAPLRSIDPWRNGWFHADPIYKGMKRLAQTLHHHLHAPDSVFGRISYERRMKVAQDMWLEYRTLRGALGPFHNFISNVSMVYSNGLDEDGAEDASVDHAERLEYELLSAGCEIVGECLEDIPQEEEPIDPMVFDANKGIEVLYAGRGSAVLLRTA